MPRSNFNTIKHLWLTIQEKVLPKIGIFLENMTHFGRFLAFVIENLCSAKLKLLKSVNSYLFYSIINILSPKTNKKHAVAAYFMYILIFNKIGGHVGGHLGFLGPHHDSSKSPSLFLHLRYASNHLCDNFLWTSYAHKHPLRDCITIGHSI